MHASLAFARGLTTVFSLVIDPRAGFDEDMLDVSEPPETGRVSFAVLVADYQHCLIILRISHLHRPTRNGCSPHCPFTHALDESTARSAFVRKQASKGLSMRGPNEKA
jgi:hypothetical protein